MNIVSVEQAVKLLKKGDLVVIPTETVYGLAADGLNAEAVSKIFVAKGRPRANPLILHVNSEKMLAKVVTEVSARARKLIKAFWPGPLTLVFDKKAIVPDETTAGLKTVCARMPAHPKALSIIKKLAKPVAAPSANRSGRPSPTRVKDACKEMPDLSVVDGGDCQFGLESTVVDARGERVKVLRLGSVSIEDIERVLAEPVLVIDQNANANDQAIERSLISPGQQFRHYSPLGQVLLFKSEIDLLKSLQENFIHKNAGIICAERQKSKYDGLEAVLTLGDSWQEQAHDLFAVLHRTEELGWENILIDLTGIGGETGIGLAILERLKRAAEM